MKISIVVPAYNVEKYIERCIQSVLKQSFGDWELLLIDDGSSDGTADICKRYKQIDKRIQYIYQQNQGQGIARNEGVKYARGKYVFFLDSDDWIREDALELLQEYAEKNDTDITFFDYIMVEQGNEKQIVHRRSKMPLRLNDVTNCMETPALLYLLEGAVWNKLYKKQILEGIMQAGHPYEDSAIIPCIMSKAVRVGQVQEALYYYWSIRENSTTNVSGSVYYLKDCLKEIYDHFEKQSCLEQYGEALRRYSEWLLLVASNQMKRHNPPDGEQFLLECQQLIDEYYPVEKRMRNYNFAVWGSYNLRCMVNRTQRNLRVPKYHFCFSNITSLMSNRKKAPIELFVNRKSHENSYREKMIKMDENQTFSKLADEDYSEIDFVFIDFLEERFLPIEINGEIITGSDALAETISDKDIKMASYDAEYLGSRAWQKKADEFIAMLQQHFLPEQIILVENYLCETKGMYKSDQKFDNQEYIQDTNKRLYDCYHYFETHYQGGVHVITNNVTEFEFADVDYPYGCFPWHQNEFLYYAIAEQMEQIMLDD